MYFPLWKQVAVPGNPETKNTGFGVTVVGSDPGKALPCPNSPALPQALSPAPPGGILSSLSDSLLSIQGSWLR